MHIRKGCDSPLSLKPRPETPLSFCIFQNKSLSHRKVATSTAALEKEGKKEGKYLGISLQCGGERNHTFSFMYYYIVHHFVLCVYMCLFICSFTTPSTTTEGVFNCSCALGSSPSL